MGQFVNKLYPFICNIDDQKDHRFFLIFKRHIEDKSSR